MASESNQEAFGKSVRRERKAQKITIEKLAEMVDMSVRQIQNIEKGNSNTRLSSVFSIVHALNCVLIIREDGSFAFNRIEPVQK